MKGICKRTDNYTIVALHPGGILIYIFTTGKVWHGHVLITYIIDREVNHNQFLVTTGVSHSIYDKR